MTKINTPLISLVTSIYNSESLIEIFINKVLKELSKITENFEIIIVDDGSPDSCWEIINKHCENERRIKGLKLSNNFGQQIALSSGLKYAKGDNVIIMDSDLQNPIEVIPLIIKNLEENNDIVYTVSKTKNNLLDEITSYLFWFFIRKVFGVRMIASQLMLRGLTNKALRLINNYTERVRFIAGITHDLGLKQKIIKVENSKRRTGKGNYSFFKRFNLMIDLVIANTVKPINFLIYLSIMSFLFTILLALKSFYNYFTYFTIPPGYTTIIIIILFFGSLTILFLGITGRYLANIYVEVRQRPLFIIECKRNF